MNIFEKDAFKNIFKNIDTALDIHSGMISAVITESEYKDLIDEKQTLYKKTAKTEMTAEKINWLVESGESKTDFTLTDRVAELITESFVIKSPDGSKTIISGGKIDLDEIFAQDVTATGTITGATLVGADITAKRIIATKEFSLAANTANVERVLYYDGSTVRVGKLLNAAAAQSGAGFEFGDVTITGYGNLNMYSGDITTPGKVQGKTVTATADMNANTMYANDWFRSKGNTGWYSQDYGGGWYMSDDIWVRVYNGKSITTAGNLSIGGYIQGNNIINTTYEYRSDRGNADWRFGSASGVGDENYFGFYNADTEKIPLVLDNIGNAYVGYNAPSGTAVGVYLGPQAAGSRAFVYSSEKYTGALWIQTRLDGAWKWFSLGQVCSKALSDIRLKADIQDTEVDNAMSIIKAMQIRSFRRKDTHKKYKIGFIADELELLDQTLVDGGGEVDGHPNYKSVNELQMIAYIVKAIQEKDAEIQALKKNLNLATNQ